MHNISTTPKGLCRWFEWVACEVCVFRGYGTYIPGGLLFRTREHDPIPPLFVAPPDGHERHNPLRGRERDAACTRGSAAEAQPRALCHNALGVAEGEHWTISYKRRGRVLHIETTGDPRKRHVWNLPCATVNDAVYIP